MITLRTLKENDVAHYIRLQKDVLLSNIRHNDEFIRGMWESVIEDTDRKSFAILTGNNNDFCGCCAVKDMNAAQPEIEIELLSRYRNQGIGFQALSTMMTDIGKRENISCFITVVEPDNVSSQKLMCKLGGVPGGVRKSDFVKNVAEFENDNMDLLDGQLINTAKTFCVEPQTLLSYDLVYEISLESLLKAKQNQNSNTKKKNIGFVNDDSRKISKTRRKTFYKKSAEDILSIIELGKENNFEEVKAQIEKYLAT